jgi:hypothetical protein
MNIPRRGEIAAYVAKQCDIPFGDEQKKIGRMKEGRAHPDTANEIAKLVVKRINQLIHREDESSPGDMVERKMARFTYRMIANEAADNPSLEFLWRSGVKFFEHHASLAARTRELQRGGSSGPTLDLEIYLYFLVLPVLANNLGFYAAQRHLQEMPEVVPQGYWFLPAVATGRADCVTPIANALTWLRLKLGDQEKLRAFLCPGAEAENAEREIDKWRCGDVVPSRKSINDWSGRFGGDKREFRIVFHLAAAVTRTWRSLIEAFGYECAIAINNHLQDLINALREARESSTQSKPDFRETPPHLARCLHWLYSGPQAGPMTLGVNYGALVVEMQTAFIAGQSPFRS